jgi:mannose-6-phosphate isomerase-like protein (cupin superfamily)
MAKTKLKPSRRAAPRQAASKRRALPKTKARSIAKAKPAAKARPRHKFTASHHREEDFKGVGLRRYAKYRDLGIKDASNGMVLAHAIRFLPPFVPEEVSKRHFHDVDFQMIYVLKGWIKTEIDGEGEHVFRAGSCWLQPPRAKHTVLGYSDDCEVLEIVLPAEFETVELE